MLDRKFATVCTLILFSLLLSACSIDDLGALFEPSPTPVPTRTRRPTSTATATETSTPSVTPTSTRTSTPIPTATSSQTPTPIPSETSTPRPPTLTFTPRPPTRTFTPAPPTDTPLPPFPLYFRWVNPGRPRTENECSFLNGTRVEGRLMRADGTLVTGAQRTAAMHLSIVGDNGGVYAYPGEYRHFPSENDGRWNAEFPKRSTDFQWKIFISAQLSDDPISPELIGTASAAEKCGQPGTQNHFVVDWIVK